MARAIAQIKFHGDHPPHQLLHLLHKDKPPVSPGRVLLRITVRPINPTDLITIRTARFSHLHNPIIGSEGFGIVEEIGEGVTKVKPGQRAIPVLWPDYLRSGQGSWQDYVVLDEHDVVPVPDGISDEVAAQFFINPWTVYGLLDDLAVPKGEYIIQTAAASVLGRQLIQLAKHWGIKTINIVRREMWKDELKAIGADEVIDSTTEDVVARVKEITGGKLAYGAVDAVGGSLTKIVAAGVRDSGKVFVYGVLSGWDISLSILDLMRGVQVSWWMLPNYISTDEKKKQLESEILKLLEAKVITPLIGKKFNFEDFQAAIKESETDARGGKVLLVS